MGLLAANIVERELQGITGWRIEGPALARDFTFPDFERAMIFVNKVAEAAEAANHHPDVDIRYDKVYIRSSSHDAGGITRRDVKLAGAINSLYSKLI